MNRRCNNLCICNKSLFICVSEKIIFMNKKLHLIICEMLTVYLPVFTYLLRFCVHILYDLQPFENYNFEVKEFKISNLCLCSNTYYANKLNVIYLYTHICFIIFFFSLYVCTFFLSVFEAFSLRCACENQCNKFNFFSLARPEFHI